MRNLLRVAAGSDGLDQLVAVVQDFPCGPFRNDWSNFCSGSLAAGGCLVLAQLLMSFRHALLGWRLSGLRFWLLVDAGYKFSRCNLRVDVRYRVIERFRALGSDRAGRGI